MNDTPISHDDLVKSRLAVSVSGQRASRNACRVDRAANAAADHLAEGMASPESFAPIKNM